MVTRRGSYAKGVAKREEILLTALEVIAAHGYRRASVRELAEAVGLSQAGLLHYFDSKEHLFTEVLRKRDEVDAANLLRAATMDDLDPLEMVTNYLQVIRHNAEVPGLVQLYAALSSEAVDEDHGAHDYFTRRYATMRAYFTRAIEALQARGEFVSTFDASSFAVTLIALADGLQVQWMHDKTIDMAAQLEQLFALVRTPAGAAAAGAAAADANATTAAANPGATAVPE